MKIALVHDYLKEYGGAESVLLALHEMSPEAPIFVMFSCVKKGSADLLSRSFGNAKIVESWSGKIPFCAKLSSPLRFLMPLVWKSFNFSDYDLVISSASWAITKGFAKGKTKEICYCHTPPRYLYGYETSRNMKKNIFIRIYALIVNHFMRMYDFNQAQKVTQFIANSEEVKRRIKKFYRRDSIVVNPPVEIDSGQARMTKNGGEYFLTGGRLAQLKNFDVIINACNKLNLPLKVYGTGAQESYLKSIAGSTIEFFGFVGNEKKQELFANCKAFIVAATDEDFGITPVEAMAFGKPVIAYRGGGYLETVVDGKTGIFFDELTVECLVETIKYFDDSMHRSIKAEDCIEQAKKFSKEAFKEKISKIISDLETDLH